jgi:hypothetical protein
MSRNGFSGLILAALAATTFTAPQARAEQKRVIVVTPPVQLQIERDRAEARQFHLRQQLNREQDRRMNSQSQSSPNVPVMRPTCTPTNGVSCN